MPHAALLIDFDNVTMGIRSDLTKELKNLLNSDIIKGKVAVQRAYADWRRYPQYIVPLAESSVDLIFAPAYGSAKKNATDIRLAIDALELVFTRPEIGTFILLSGDSDFSSLVLKLKEYGKYVIGVGIRESASDLLVQNCDEYYSYSALTGLTRAGDEVSIISADPWELAERAVRRMVENNDVMRSDRLKQVILDLDPNFDEKALGFTKFNRFVQEAASRGLLSLRKLENGQYEIGLAAEPVPGSEAAADADLDGSRRRSRRGGRRGGREARPRDEEATARTHVGAAAEAPLAGPAEPSADRRPLPPRDESPRDEPPALAAESRQPAARAAEPREEPAAAASRGGPAVAPTGPVDLRSAYDLLLRATGDLAGGRGDAVRDSDVKRRMLELQTDWDEGALGFSKFSRFLRQAHDAEVIDLLKLDNGNYEVSLPEGVAPITSARHGAREERGRSRGRGRERRDRGEPQERAGQREIERGAAAERTARRTATPAEAAQPEVAASAAEGPAGTQATTAAQPKPSPGGVPVAATPAAAPSARAAQPAPAGRTLGFRRGSRGGPAIAAPPPLLEGQTVGAAAPAPPEPAAARETVAAQPAAAQQPGAADPRSLGLPTGRAEVIRHLASYQGVGRKSAETLVDALGAQEVFRVLLTEPERARDALGGRRGERLLAAWREDRAGRATDHPKGPAAAARSAGAAGRGARKRGRPAANAAPAGSKASDPENGRAAGRMAGARKQTGEATARKAGARKSTGEAAARKAGAPKPTSAAAAAESAGRTQADEGATARRGGAKRGRRGGRRGGKAPTGE